MSPEQLGQLFVGLGGLGMVGAALAGSILAFIVPWWALFDLLGSKRDSNTKIVVAIILVPAMLAMLMMVLGTKKGEIRFTPRLINVSVVC